MRAYVIRRVLLVVPTLLILSMIVFLLVRFIPGDVIDAMQADFAFTAATADAAQSLESQSSRHHEWRLQRARANYPLRWPTNHPVWFWRNGRASPTPMCGRITVDSGDFSEPTSCFGRLWSSGHMG